jgi:cell division protein ZapA
MTEHLAASAGLRRATTDLCLARRWTGDLLASPDMASRTVQLRVGGQTYRVVSSASEEELGRLAAIVDDKLRAMVPNGRAITPQAMLLAAMALAHDLEEERARSRQLSGRARDAFGRMLERVDAALATTSAPSDASGAGGSRER